MKPLSTIAGSSLRLISLRCILACIETSEPEGFLITLYRQCAVGAVRGLELGKVASGQALPTKFGTVVSDRAG